MVDTALFARPEPPHHPALLLKAQKEGRIRGTALDIYQQVLDKPRKADATLSRSLREARHLHSRERRFVADSLYALIRYHRLLADLVESDDPNALWEAWLSWQGLESGPPLPIEEHVQTLITERTPVEALSLVGGFDSYVAQALVESLGDEVWPFLWASNRRGPIVLRTNPLKASREAVQKALRAQDIETSMLSSTPYGLQVSKPANLKGQRSYQEGWFEIQDQGSQELAALCPSGVKTVIDYCAGAGGKTLAIGAVTPLNSLIACDIREKALRQLEKRALRAGLQNLTIHLHGSAPLVDEVDVVFVDAPCSGLGTLRGHPELRFRLNRRSIKQALRLQRTILDEASRHVRIGGELIYGTCSVLKTENEDVVEAFLSDHPGFQMIPEKTLRRAPHTHNTDGFYGQALRRTL